MWTCLNNACSWDGLVTEEGEPLSRQRWEAARRQVMSWVAKERPKNEQ
jgi:hypothetical protein